MHHKSLSALVAAVLLLSTPALVFASTTITHTLTKGSSGSDVLALQQFLLQQGYLTTTPNGTYGPATTQAVSAFQKAHSLSASGSVGAQTLALIQTLTSGTTTPTATLTATTNPTGLVTQAQLQAAVNAAVQQTLDAVHTQLYGASTTMAGGGMWGAIAAASRISALQGVTISGATVNGVSGLQASDIPALPYVPTNYFAGGGDISSSTVVAKGTSVSKTLASIASDVASVGMSATTYGVPNDGVTDATASLTSFLQQGGNLYIPDGTYLIHRPGPNAGGVNVYPTKDTTVTCGPKAVITTDGLDSIMVDWLAPVSGVGLPSGGVTIRWRGCTFDQTAQYGSQVMPFTAQYPPVNQGQSNITDGMDFRGAYTSAGTTYSAFKLVEVHGVTFNAGAHWQYAGGDSAMYVESAQEAIVEDNIFIGSRDCALYTSASDPTGVVGTNYHLNNNTFTNTIFGLCLKRGVIGFEVRGNTFHNTLAGALVLRVLTPPYGQAQNGIIADNIGYGVNQLVVLEDSINVNVEHNTSNNAGAFLADGSTLVPLYPPSVVLAEGATGGIIAYNVGTTPNAGLAAAFPSDRDAYLLTTSAASIIPSGIKVFDNTSNGWRVLGMSNCTNCVLNGNTASNSTTANWFTTTGSNSQYVGYDSTNGAPSYWTPLEFSDGTAVAPTIARSASAGSGLYWGTGGTVNISVQGTNRLTASSTGIVVNGLFVTPSTPAHNTTSCITGQVSTDANYLYYCKASNSWDRIAWPGATW